MSTFDGIVEEFPFITIDYFRKNPERPPPLACFLSHAHSDHLQGLESFRAPFIYCSAATRELLLRIEKYPHRMNFNNGILESRRLHYKHLSKLLRPIPLNTPTDIELTPRQSIRVTLLDANHCTGAVMFFIEGDGKAILYTGDIRSESWWVNGLIRHPILIPYTLGTKRLDKIYLDTTFAHTSHTFHEFPSKAEGLAELLHKLEPYPEDTIFYFRAWTFGYEEVWVALAAALKSKVHVDRYQIGLYKAVSSSCKQGSGAYEAPFLCGFELGNRIVPGCLTEDPKSRIHSCEPGIHCSAASAKKTVFITPIVSRTTKGSDIPEIGAGGGLGDLYQIHELELPDQSSLVQLEQLCSEKIQDPQALSRARDALSTAFRSRSRALSLDGYGMKDANEMPLEELVDVLSRGRLSEESILPENSRTPAALKDKFGNTLPRTIHFPYSRHSSYTELCELVGALRPRDIYPCTVDPQDWGEDISMQSLFGHLCSDNTFVHDQHMREIIATEIGERPRKRTRRDAEQDSQSTQHSSLVTASDSRSFQNVAHTTTEKAFTPSGPGNNPATPEPPRPKPIIILSSPSQPSAVTSTSFPDISQPPIEPTSSQNNDSLTLPSPSPRAAKDKRNAIRQAWHILNNAQKTPSQRYQLQLGSLPSSWSTNEDISQPNASVPEARKDMEDLVGQTSESQLTAIHNPAVDNSQSTRTATAHAAELATPLDEDISGITLDADIVMETDAERDSTSDTERETEHQTKPNPNQPSSQQSTHTISTSAFASQDQSQSQNQISRATDADITDDGDEEYINLSDEDQNQNRHHDETNNNVETQAQPRRLLRSESSLRARRAAYLAAREDSFDAWSGLGVVSAGNNHTEEEVEL